MLSPLVLLMACGNPTDATAVPPLRVVAMTPTDGESGVGLGTSIELSFSRAVASASVSPDSVRVVVAGEPVDAQREVLDDRLTLTPAEDLPLLATVTVEVTLAVWDTDGVGLDSPFAGSFRVRDGVWDATPRTFPEWVHSTGPYVEPVGDPSGDVVLPLPDLYAPLAHTDLDVVTYTAGDGAFAIDEDVRTTQGKSYLVRVRAGVNDEGDAAIVATDDDSVYVHRRDAAGWPEVDRSDASALGAGFEMAVDADGAVIAVWKDGGDIVTGRFDGDWVSGMSLTTGASTLWSVSSIADGVLVVFELEAGGLAAVVRTGGSFGAVRRVGGLDADINWVRVGRSPSGPVVTWEEDGAELAYATWDGPTGTWTSALVGDGSGGAQVCRNTAGQRIAVLRDGSGALASAAEPGRDLSVPERLVGATALDLGGCFLDESGNGHGLWASFGEPEVYWARFVDGAWEPARALGIQTTDVRGWFADPQGRLVVVFGRPDEVGTLRFR